MPEAGVAAPGLASVICDCLVADFAQVICRVRRRKPFVSCDCRAGRRPLFLRHGLLANHAFVQLAPPRLTKSHGPALQSPGRRAGKLLEGRQLALVAANAQRLHWRPCSPKSRIGRPPFRTRRRRRPFPSTPSAGAGSRVPSQRSQQVASLGIARPGKRRLSQCLFPS